MIFPSVFCMFTRLSQLVQSGALSGGTVRPMEDGPVLRSLGMQTLGEASAWPEALQLLLGNPKQHWLAKPWLVENIKNCKNRSMNHHNYIYIYTLLYRITYIYIYIDIR